MAHQQRNFNKKLPIDVHVKKELRAYRITEPDRTEKSVNGKEGPAEFHRKSVPLVVALALSIFLAFIALYLFIICHQIGNPNKSADGDT